MGQRFDMEASTCRTGLGIRHTLYPWVTEIPMGNSYVRKYNHHHAHLVLDDRSEKLHSSHLCRPREQEYRSEVREIVKRG